MGWKMLGERLLCMLKCNYIKEGAVVSKKEMTKLHLMTKLKLFSLAFFPSFHFWLTFVVINTTLKDYFMIIWDCWSEVRKVWWGNWNVSLRLGVYDTSNARNFSYSSQSIFEKSFQHDFYIHIDSWEQKKMEIQLNISPLL